MYFAQPSFCIFEWCAKAVTNITPYFPENIPPPPPPSFEDTQNTLDDLAYQMQNLG